jgi:transposase
MKRLEIENRTNITNRIRSYLGKNPESKFIHRIQAILQFADREDATCDSIGELFGHSPRSISNWVKSINRTGTIESLRCKPKSGRPSQLTQEQKKATGVVLSGSLPEKQGLAGKTWNGKNLSLYIERQYGITLKVRACQLLLREIGFRKGAMSRCGDTGSGIPKTSRKRKYPQTHNAYNEQ